MAKPVTVTKERILSAASARALTAAPTPSFLHSAPSRESGTPMHALMGQNQLLQELRACPGYIQDEEWAELERMLRNSFNLTPESLRETHPDLKKGDIRAYILSHL